MSTDGDNPTTGSRRRRHRERDRFDQVARRNQATSDQGQKAVDATETTEATEATVATEATETLEPESTPNR